MSSSLVKKILYYAQQQYTTFCVLNSNGYTDAHGNYELLIGLGVQQAATTWGDFTALPKAWRMGFLGYDIKNKFEVLHSNHPDLVDFPELYFFVPETVLQLKNEELTVVYTCKTENNTIVEQITNTGYKSGTKAPISLQQHISKTTYIQKINAIKQHIQAGDVYELNFCMAFSAQQVNINPVDTYLELNKLSPTPFSAFLKFNNRYILCASPERYLQRRENQIMSQPIKGTAARNSNAAIDEQNKYDLRHSQKEQSENVMIVDLVRNDLSRFATRGSVHVPELFGIHSFPQWHQMISTISCEVTAQTDLTTIISQSFPMGSMTGAPKVAAMQLIERYETIKRGAYSGTLGYITPENDFDFNVIIRSILYNAQTQQLSFEVGSAITANSEAEAEYEECLLKAQAIMRVLA